ncbi:unnamed protein product [Penicillium pancosmium]
MSRSIDRLDILAETTSTGLPCLHIFNGRMAFIAGPAFAKVMEIYFARCLGMSLLTIAVLTVMLTGSIPLNATIAEPVSTEESDPKAPYALPTLMVTSVLHASSAFYAYTWYATGGQGAFALAVSGNSILAAIGLWCLLFASSNGRISRRTGADKRTTGFPFANSEAAKKHGGKKGL